MTDRGPTVLPDPSLGTDVPSSERDVLNALRQGLDPDCLIIHSYPWVRPERNQDGRGVHAAEGEIDFLVLDPARGLLVLEVKGGTVRYSPPNPVEGLFTREIWTSTDWYGRVHQIKDPVKQVKNNFHKVKNMLLERVYPGAKVLPFPHGYGIVFPGCRLSASSPPGADHDILLDSRALDRMGDAVNGVLEYWNRSSRSPRPISRPELDKIRAALYTEFCPTPVLSRRIDSQEEILVRLTRTQQLVAQGLWAHRKYRVSGTAGSGKTLIAMKRAMELASLGHRTLFLCYNKHLAFWLQQQNRNQNLTIRNFHSLCRELCGEARVPFNPSKDQEFWDQDACDLLDEALDILPTRYDAILVDEAQDFRSMWWYSVTNLLASPEEGYLYIFYDPDQTLYATADYLPDIQNFYPLQINCRNTQAINETCSRILEKPAVHQEDAAPGRPPEIIVCHSPGAMRQNVKKILGSWMHAGDLRSQQIAILGPYVLDKSSLADVKELRSIPLSPEIRSWMDGQSLLYATARGFKGLEADAVLMIDVGGFSASFTRNDLYVACSRAKHELVVLVRDEQTAERLRVETGR